jgi:hypothetical protein
MCDLKRGINHQGTKTPRKAEENKAKRLLPRITPIIANQNTSFAPIRVIRGKKVFSEYLGALVF